MMNSKQLAAAYLTVLSAQAEAEKVIVALSYRAGNATQIRLYWGEHLNQLIQDEHPGFSIGRDFVRWDAPMVSNQKKALRSEDEQDLLPYRFNLPVYYKDLAVGENGTRSAALEARVLVGLQQVMTKEGPLKGAAVRYTGNTCKAGVHDYELRTPDGHVYTIELKGWNGLIGWSTSYHKVTK